MENGEMTWQQRVLPDGEDVIRDHTLDSEGVVTPLRPHAKTIDLGSAFRIVKVRKGRRGLGNGTQYDIMELRAGDHFLEIYVSPTGTGLHVEVDGDVLS